MFNGCLHSLDLTCCSMNSIEHYANATTIPSLQRLDVSFNRINQWEPFGLLTNLTTLNLSDNILCLEPVISALRNLTKIQELMFDRCTCVNNSDIYAGQNGALVLMNECCAPHMPELRVLSFRQMGRITEMEIQYLLDRMREAWDDTRHPRIIDIRGTLPYDGTACWVSCRDAMRFRMYKGKISLFS